MSIIENTLTWIGQNKLASFMSLLCFILFISTIAMAVQKGEWEEKANNCQRQLTTVAPSTSASPSTEPTSTEQSSTESSTNAPTSTEPSSTDPSSSTEANPSTSST